MSEVHSAGSCMGPRFMGSGALGYAHRRSWRACANRRFGGITSRPRGIRDQWHADIIGPDGNTAAVAQAGGAKRISDADWWCGGVTSRSQAACCGRDAGAVGSNGGADLHACGRDQPLHTDGRTWRAYAVWRVSHPRRDATRRQAAIGRLSHGTAAARHAWTLGFPLNRRG